EEIIVNKPIVLENIYYDLDKSDIRPDAKPGLDKLVQIMNENPDIRIELGSHTDSRADDRYNDRLSQRRAESAVNYIVEHGISRDRITAKGYGESQLVNGCKNGVKCTEIEHQANRRTEFKVVGFTK
ncbi:MAG: OmpA family protein, partial [Flavobacteriales bacterium]